MTTPCRECGSPFTPRRVTGAFCSGDCKRAFNNRRAMRGAELYDVVMSMRFDRAAAAEHQAWSLLCRMAMAFRAQDEAERSARKSWCPIKDVKMRKPVLSQIMVALNYRAGR